MAGVRTALAHASWWACVLVAVGYAAVVALTGLDAPTEERWVDVGYRWADAGGGDVFARDGWLAERLEAREEESSAVEVALVSWGSASGAWLLLGWVLSALLGPRRRGSTKSRTVS